MVKTPKTRHSKSHREPVTIELPPGEVSRIVEQPAEEEARAAAEERTPEGGEMPRAENTPPEPAAGAAPAADAQGASGAAAPLFDELPPRPAAGGDGERRDDFVAADPARPKRGGMNVIAAGLAGAIIALAGAAGLQYAGILAAPGTTASLDGLNNQVSALKTQIAALSGSDNGGDALARIKVLSDALEQVKSDVAGLKTAVGDQAGAAQAVGDLRDKVAAVETAVAELGESTGVAEADLAPLNEKIAALDGLVKSTTDAAGEQQGRLGALEQSVTQLSAKVEAQASQPKIALSIAASALKAALDRGAPFSAELETFAAIAPDAPQLAALRPYAEKGVATRADIAADVDAAANAMVAAATPPDADAGFFQSLVASAERLVNVRPVGAVSGPGVPETVARLEAAVERGDYAKALAEYDSLPEAVKAAAADFAGKLEARLAVETAIDALIADAMKA